MIRSRTKTILWSILGVCGIAAAATATAQRIGAQQAAPPKGDEQSWLAVAPGLVEPRSGEIKILPSTIGEISQVVVSPGEQVFAGELLVRLGDQDALARVETARAQVAMQRRARNDQAAGKAADRRRAEDALAEAEIVLVDARDAFDRAAIAMHGGGGTVANLAAARTALTNAENALAQRRAFLRQVQSQSGTPLPTQNEGQLNVGRSNLWLAEVELEKLRIRAPIAGTILQVNAKVGELAAPTAPDPLVVLGDLSALHVRAELDERDIGEVKVGQRVVVRADAFPGRNFAGTVTSIAPLVQAGRINSPGSRNLTDFDVTQVGIDITDSGPLLVGMKVDVYFERAAASKAAGGATSPAGGVSAKK
ncbi:MAG: efflux RND transporter periplasmic adaptor subunit [Xanthobacteraceae bacterium]